MTSHLIFTTNEFLLKEERSYITRLCYDCADILHVTNQVLNEEAKW
jgi:hypothetical protein